MTSAPRGGGGGNPKRDDCQGGGGQEILKFCGCHISSSSLGAALLLVEDGDEVGGIALGQLDSLLVELPLPHLSQEVALSPERGALSDVLELN